MVIILEAVFLTASLGQRYKSFLPSQDVYLAPPPVLLVAAMMKLYIGSRQPAASSSTDPAPHTVKDDFPEALTYRFNDNSAWVPAARTHEVSSIFLIVLVVRLTGFGRRSGGRRPREARIP